MSRGLRNNNPLNIRKGEKWEGMSEHQYDGAFVQFKGVEWGYRAAFCLLRTYIKRYKCDTLDKIIGRWAPPNENDTENYISFVSRVTGIERDEPISFTDKDTMVDLVCAMSRMENGVDADKDKVRKGYSLI